VPQFKLKRSMMVVMMMATLMAHKESLHFANANIYRHHTKMSKAMGLSTRGLKFNYSVTRAPVAVN